MRPLLVASVPHTGTMFTLALLPGQRGTSMLGPYREGHKYYCHLSEPHARRALHACSTVVPVRQFEEVVASWERRRLNIDELSRQWEEMLRLRDVFFLHIDAPDRDQQLLNLSMTLGHPLKTDWKPINRFTGPRE